jgi:two-component system sensor histidine kinase KdpD
MSEPAIVRLKGKSVAHAVAEFVNEKHITQVIFGRSATRGWKRYFYLSAIHQFLRDAPAVDVHIVTQEPAITANRNMWQTINTFL